MKKTKLIEPVLFFALSILWLVLVKTVDVLPVGPAGTKIGFSHMNLAVFNATGVHIALYDITGILGIVAIMEACVFAVVGLVQLIKRKSLAKVDREIIVLGFLYATVIILYIFFEKVIVNYRPVIMPGKDFPEASFPSSHTMTVCVVMGSAVRMYAKYIKSIKLRKILTITSFAILAVTVVGRLLCGVHWLSDIIGGILISLFLLSTFDAVSQ